MRITFVIGSLAGGGAERVVSVLANQFSDLGHQVSIITLAKEEYVYPLHEAIIRRHIATDVRIKGLSGIQRVVRLSKIIRQLKSDMVISFTSAINIYVLLAKLGFGSKVVVSERNSPDRNPSSTFMRWIRNRLYPLSDGFVFQTESARQYFPGQIQNKGIVIANPLESNLPQPYPGIRSDKVISVGRLEEQKNYALLLNAFAAFKPEHPDYVLHIYGDGSLKKKIQELILDLNLEDSVILKGYVKNWHEEVLDARMYVLSSDYEGMPNALMEAMAIGLPSIATDCPCGGPGYIIADKKNGLLFPVGDQAALVNCMLSIADYAGFADRISKQGISDSQRFDISQIASQWLSFIEKVCAKL